MAVIISIKDNPNHTLIVELEGIIFKLGFLYNSGSSFWAMTIWDEDDTLLVSGIKIIANYPLIFSHKNNSLPKGDFYCEIADVKSSITRDSFSSGEAKLLYLTQEEIETI